jgi:hypothetical protein
VGICRRWKARTRHVSPFKHPLAPTREKQPGQHSPSHSCSPHSHIPAAGAGPCRLRGRAAGAGPCRLRGAGPCRLRRQVLAGCGGQVLAGCGGRLRRQAAAAAGTAAAAGYYHTSRAVQSYYSRTSTRTAVHTIEPYSRTTAVPVHVLVQLYWQ